jgi:hypothetical protein
MPIAERVQYGRHIAEGLRHILFGGANLVANDLAIMPQRRAAPAAGDARNVKTSIKETPCNFWCRQSLGKCCYDSGSSGVHG